MGLEIEIGDWGLGNGIGDRDWGLELGSVWGLGLGIKIWIGDWGLDWGSDWGLGLEIGIGD